MFIYTIKIKVYVWLSEFELYHINLEKSMLYTKYIYINKSHEQINRSEEISER